MKTILFALLLASISITARADDLDDAAAACEPFVTRADMTAPINRKRALEGNAPPDVVSKDDGYAAGSYDYCVPIVRSHDARLKAQRNAADDADPAMETARAYARKNGFIKP